MNRRIALIAVFLVGIVTGGAVVPRVLPQAAVAQDVPAEVTLVDAGDNNTLWAVGDPLMHFTVYRGVVTAQAVSEDYRAILDETNPVRAFTAAVDQARKE